MTLNLPLLYFVWTEEYCQTSPNKNKSPNIWHVTSILVCCIFGCAPWQFASENFWKQESFFRTLWNIDELKVGGTWIWPNFCYNSDLWTSTILLYRAVGDSRLGRAIPPDFGKHRCKTFSFDRPWITNPPYFPTFLRPCYGLVECFIF